jgi:hypothetical protein
MDSRAHPAPASRDKQKITWKWFEYDCHTSRTREARDSSTPNAWATQNITKRQRYIWDIQSRRKLVDMLPESEKCEMVERVLCKALPPQRLTAPIKMAATGRERDDNCTQRHSLRVTKRSTIPWRLPRLMMMMIMTTHYCHAQNNDGYNEDVRWKDASVLKSARCAAKEGEIVEGYVDSCGVCNGDGGSCSAAAVVLLVLTVIGLFGLLFVWARFMHLQVCISVCVLCGLSCVCLLMLL